MTMQDYDLTAASCVMPVDHIRPCYIWVEYTSDEWSVDVRLSTTKNKTSLVVVKFLPVNGRPLQWHTPRLFLHCLQAPQTSWLIPHTLLTPCGKLQDCSRTARQETKDIKWNKWSLALQRNNIYQTFMNLMCRAKATHSPFLSVWLNRKLTLSK